MWRRSRLPSIARAGASSTPPGSSPRTPLATMSARPTAPGHPVCGSSVALVGLWISAGLGSLLAGRVETVRRARCCLVLAVLLSAAAALLQPALRRLDALGDPARFSIALGLVALLGL